MNCGVCSIFVPLPNAITLCHQKYWISKPASVSTHSQAGIVAQPSHLHPWVGMLEKSGTTQEVERLTLVFSVALVFTDCGTQRKNSHATLILMYKVVVGMGVVGKTCLLKSQWRKSARNIICFLVAVTCCHPCCIFLGASSLQLDLLPS